MKKIFLGVLALTLVSGAAFASDGGKHKKKTKKAKIECTKGCPDKDCHKICPNIPGCICH